MNLNPEALAVLVAALDGHDPATTITANGDGTTTVTATGATGPSDIALTTRDLLDTLAPHHAVAEVARTAPTIITATATAMGYPIGAVSPRMVADVLREMIRGSREGEELSEDD